MKDKELNKLGMIYMDHNATTRIDPEIAKKMLEYQNEVWGNPSSLHVAGRVARDALEMARENVARTIGARPGEIIFTSGGTEADNIAIIALGTMAEFGMNHIISTQIEHHAVLNSCMYLCNMGHALTLLPPDHDCLIDPGDVEKAIKADKYRRTCLISVMHANNETGTIQMISEIGEIAKEHDIPFHCDAVQSFGKIVVDVDYLKVDLLSISSHKIHGPKGVGALYVRGLNTPRGVKIRPIFQGGHQEGGIRPGTENVPAIMAFADAAKRSRKRLYSVEVVPFLDDPIADPYTVGTLADDLKHGILSRLGGVVRNGHNLHTLPNTVNLSFDGVEGESLVLALAGKGICVSTGAACEAGSLESSHVLKSMGLSPERCEGAVRFSLGEGNTAAEVETVVDEVCSIVERFTDMPGGV